MLHDDALRLLTACAWPGNVRELRNTLERALMLSDSEHIDARALAPFIDSKPAALPAPAEKAQAEAAVPYAQAMIDFERRFLSDALRASGGRVAEAAKRIGIGRATMYKKIAALGIEV